jgi:MOSC domain-containing protein YiiM
MIERIFVSSVPGGPQLEVERVTVVAGAGIEGDRYFARHDEPGQNITLVEAEEIESFLAEQGRPGDLSVTHRNLVTRGVRLNHLVGREFLVGEVRLRGVELCEPCRGLGSFLASSELGVDKVVKRFLHRAGLRADVLSSGFIARGAKVTNDA